MIKKNGKLVAVLLMVFIMAFALAGCGNTETNEQNDKGQASVAETDTGSDEPEQQVDAGSDEQEQQADISDDSTSSQSEETSGDGKILVAYFSHSGNTKGIAEEIQKKTGADIFEITTVNEYSSDYNTVLDEAKAEQNDNARPELSAKVENMEQYQTVIIGFPIWWGDMPMALYSFLDEYDLSGKTVLPFCTHGGSGLCGTDKNVQQEEKDAKVAEGLAIKDSSLDDAGGDIDQWLKNNGVVK
ncbi:MAG: NAD(P)H-dependent oxidoreductase [Lachnospiraceae bacterium]|nr:NAD(P)H-dependent oxidoreductase [Lachnospiraceae bacterium]